MTFGGELSLGLDAADGAVEGAAEDEASDLEAARRGDSQAFGRLVEAHQRRVTRLAYRFVRDPDLADSVAQDAFVKAWTGLASFRGDCPFGAWLARIVVNLCRDQLKRKRLVLFESSLVRQEDGDDVGPLATAIDAGPDPEGHAHGRELGRRIAREAASLPRMQREVFALRYYDEMPLADIAAAFRVDVGTIKTHLFRATRRMRESLEADYGRRIRI